LAKLWSTSKLSPTTASDLDGDDLFYNLHYSPDNGGTWYPVAVNITGTAVTLDLDWIKGSDQALLRVIASDEADTTFTVDDKAPWVKISHPADSTKLDDTLTNLSGAALDLEEGSLSEGQLVWTSDIDGLLGTGGTLWDIELSQGVHQITLTATDSQSNPGSDTVTITVPRLVDIRLPLMVR
jgi:hypothetical protein